MEFLKDLYCRKVWYLQNIAGKQAVLGMGDMQTYRLMKGIKTISTVILPVIPKQKVNHEDLETGKVLPILEAIDERPDSLQKALVSWLTWPNEERPSAVYISDGEMTPDLFKDMAYTLACAEIPLTQIGREAFEEAREKSKNATLSKPIEV